MNQRSLQETLFIKQLDVYMRKEMNKQINKTNQLLNK